MRHLISLTLLATVLATAWLLPGLTSVSGGRDLAFSLLAGATLGVVLQRSRFCFLCHARDWFDRDDPRGLLAIVLAIAVGSIGYHLILGSWLPVPDTGRLPPDAHIGPVSWALVLAGLAFGLGMAVSGSCISAHWYRLGEGSPVAPFALIGTAGGFMLGFLSWNPLYSATIATAPVPWLPAYLGYGGSLLLQLAVLLALAAWLWRGFGRAQVAASQTDAAGNQATTATAIPASFGEALGRLLQGRWPYWVGGLVVGLIAALVIIRVKPLGVTAALGSQARALAESRQWIPERLDGLDGFAGCATVIRETLLTPNGLLVAGLVLGALAAGIASRQFAPRWPTLRDAVRGLLGGALLGWGAMVGIGCTIGNTLSGIMAGAVSGWVFTAAMLVAVAAGLALQQRFPALR